MQKQLFLVVLLPLLIGSADAKPVKGSHATVDQCEAAPSNVEYTACWKDRARQARSKADAAYAHVRRVAEKSDLQESYGGDARHWLGNPLRDSQTTWVRNLNRQCLFERRIARGGTGGQALESKCQYRLSRARVDELESAIKLIES
jgi:uncharacterized protein YecT (DUF1311 family)